ncbi:MAG: hypothetical protein M1836_001840 [Candelina mexicana]|nr:MAG: hypothetical protein M1836_001840 [Candelina mexicana]
MPAERSTSTKSKTSAFKPPRPASKPTDQTPNTQKKTTLSKSSKKRRPSNPTPEDEPPLEDEHHQQDRDVATIMESSQDTTPTLPPKLLTKLLHEHFKDERTRINKDANKVVAKYMETFVKEALARAALEREESARGGGATDGFLEVEDLESLAPQLLLDF